MSHSYSSQNLRADVVSIIANVESDEAKALELSKKVALKVSEGQLKLVELVICLREYITSPEQIERQHALHCLSTILGELPKHTLLKNDVSVILDFYLGKFDDIYCMKETLYGLSHIVNMKCFYSNQVSSVLKPLKDDYQSTQYLAATRYYAFLVLQHLLEKFRESMSTNLPLNNLFIETFLSIAGGEKDPRNLLISFHLNSAISSALENISQYKEDLFDTLFCYFPITFKPPKNDPYRITNIDLKVALRSAISASPYFEEDAFGNLIDKMTASSPSVKNDTLLTMKACIERFGGEACIKNWVPIWNALKFEIMNNVDADESVTESNEPEFNNYEESLRIITSISAQLLNLKEGAFDKFQSHIFDELEPNFKYEKDLKQSSAILAAVARTNVTSFNKVMDDVLKLFFDNVSDLDVNKLKLLILNLSFFFDAYIEVFSPYSNKAQNKAVPDNKLAQYKDQILMILSKSLKGSSKSEVSLRTLSVVQLTKLVKMPGFLSGEEVSLIVQYLTETILTDDNKNVYFACLEGLKVTSDVSENSVVEISLNQMLKHLEKEGTHTVVLGEEEAVPVERILKVILDFTTSRHKLVVESIIGISNIICHFSKYVEEKEYCFMLVSCLYSLFDNNQEVLTNDVASHLKKSIETELLASSKNVAIYSDDHNLHLISAVFYFLNVNAPQANHQIELDRFLVLFTEDTKVLKSPARSVIIFAKLLSAFDKACKIPGGLLLNESIRLLKVQHEKCSEFEKLAYLELLAVLSNKWCTEDNVNANLDISNTALIDLEIEAWCTKGLAMKNSKLAETYTDKFVKLLGDADIGPASAKLFGVFVMDIPTLDRIKGISWNNNVRLLYKQKLFSDVAPKLVSGYSATSDMSLKANYLLALSLLLKNTPNKITINYIPNLLSLLLQAVQLNNSDVRVSALTTIRGTVNQASQLITEHIHSLIPLLMRLTNPDKHNAYLVRLTALEILRDFTDHVPLNYLLPYKDDIIKGLAVALDDKKRRVRKTCIDTRQAYFELGQVPFE
ncbi:Met18p [Lachancea thermotolerans CBS 6340]|uniref:MMS19 nucleotide excision repair protein n=1 Tax=Lachancea thermotolerans (strain ATCC 56472 / CBS 6340 / NRRL Y-8284) TaxID=559295 RepID=C5DMI2_LACTC|nr:KLTH0G09152p [Lachancea thermotolerans CBS 6340]CAR24993.1 KLTH0G09152p [Lachancea thermotolerans CBS 6340]